MAARDKPQYPTGSVPEEAAQQKLLGLYDQRQPGLLLQRVRVPGGRLTAQQWQAIADAAEAVGARDALHLTTRQCVEVHGLTLEAVPVLQAALAEAGLSTVGAAGDTVRNFTVDAEAGLTPGTVDLLPLAEAMTTAVESLPGIWELPRKFKISLSGSSDARMRPWMSDVGIIADEAGTFSAIVAGSLGARPGTGIHFHDDLTAEETVALCVAAVRLHALEGDRENRRRARLRHVRERMGDVAFLERLEELFAEERGRHDATIPLPRASDLDAAPRARMHVRLAPTHGDVPLRTLRELAAVAEAAGGEIRIGIEHDLHLFGVEIDALPLEAQAWLRPGRVVACPGTALCPKAAAPTYEAADALAQMADAHPEALFAISGCPNSCSHAMVADIGLIGRMKRVGDARIAVFDVYADGQAGTGPALAEKSVSAVPLAQLAEVVQSALSEA